VGVAPSAAEDLIATATGAYPAWAGQPGIPHTQIEGTVRRGGEPVGGVLVSLSSRLTDAGVVPVLRVTSGADGRYRFAGLPAFAFIVSVDAPDDDAVAIAVDTRDEAAARKAIDLELAGCSHRFQGLVRDSDGRPAADAVVRPIIGRKTLGEAIRVGARGAFTLCDDRREPMVRIEAPDHAPAIVELSRQEPVVVSLSPAATLEGTLTGPGARGAVVTAFPVVGPAEDVFPSYAVADRDGRFRIQPLAARTYEISVLGAEVGTRDYVRIDVAAGEVVTGTIALERRPSIAGTLIGKAGPVAGAPVYAYRAKPNATSMLAVSQADGSFVLAAVPLGEVEIMVRGKNVAGGAIEVAAEGNAPIQLRLD
jgi:hypothetical protein